ncbi:MAG: hypothetical protein Fur0025_36720 [Oscillatoriaceae cyanobacterium]
MRKLTQQEKDRQAVFTYSRCNGCIHANSIYQPYYKMTEVDVNAKVWFDCAVDLTELNKPLRFTVKCPHRYDTKPTSA